MHSPIAPIFQIYKVSPRADRVHVPLHRNFVKCLVGIQKVEITKPKNSLLLAIMRQD